MYGGMDLKEQLVNSTSATESIRSGLGQSWKCRFSSRSEWRPLKYHV